MLVLLVLVLVAGCCVDCIVCVLMPTVVVARAGAVQAAVAINSGRGAVAAVSERC